MSDGMCKWMDASEVKPRTDVALRHSDMAWLMGTFACLPSSPMLESVTVVPLPTVTGARRPKACMHEQQ